MPLFTTDRTKHYQAVCLGCGTLQDTHPYADNLVEGYICHDVQACMVRQHTQPMIEGGQANAHIILYEASLRLPMAKYAERYRILQRAYVQVMRSI